MSETPQRPIVPGVRRSEVGEKRKWTLFDIVAIAAAVGFFVLLRNRVPSAEEGKWIAWASGQAITGLVVLVWIVTRNHTRALAIRALCIAMAAAGLVGLGYWVVHVQDSKEWWANGWLWLTGALILWVIPSIRGFQWFKSSYWPYIVSQAEFGEELGVKKCVLLLWVWYKEDVLWVLMVVAPLILWVLMKLELCATGYAILLIMLAHSFTRMVVEEDTDPEKDLPRMAAVAGGFAGMLVGVWALFGFKPFVWFHRWVMSWGEMSIPDLFLLGAGYFLFTSVWTIVKSWSAHRAYSDGKYIYGIGVLGSEEQMHVFSGVLSHKDKDFFEALLQSSRLVVNRAGERFVMPVIFFVRHTLKSLFQNITPGEANALVHQEPPHDHPGDAHEPGAAASGPIDTGHGSQETPPANGHSG